MIALKNASGMTTYATSSNWTMIAGTSNSYCDLLVSPTGGYTDVQVNVIVFDVVNNKGGSFANTHIDINP